VITNYFYYWKRCDENTRTEEYPCFHYLNRNLLHKLVIRYKRCKCEESNELNQKKKWKRNRDLERPH